MHKKNNTIDADNAEDHDIVMSMHNLLEYYGNYSMTSGSFLNYQIHKPDNVDDDLEGKSFKYKIKIKRKTDALPPKQPVSPEGD